MTLAPRDIADILAEWRSLERERDAATDDETRATLDARIRRVRLEHADALDVQAHTAEELGSRPSLEPRDGGG